MFYIMRQFILLIKNIEKHTALLNKNKKKGGGGLVSICIRFIKLLVEVSGVMHLSITL